ncbi:hypothetical protein HUX53_22720 [Actinomadura sp. BRA 177]|nr:hypothetical protein [Actinomadura sp. BRA 177]
MPDSALMPTYQYAIFMTGFLLAAVGLTCYLIASAIGWTHHANVVIDIIVGISAICGYWLAYLGYKMTRYARQRRR